MHSDVLFCWIPSSFPGGTWITRNRFKNDQGAFWMSIPVWKREGLQRIDEVGICHEGSWKKKHLKSLYCAYADAPTSSSICPCSAVFSDAYDKIADMNRDIISLNNGFARHPNAGDQAF